MFFLSFLCFCFVFVRGESLEERIYVYTPEEILNDYSKSSDLNEANRMKKTVLNISDAFHNVSEEISSTTATHEIGNLTGLEKVQPYMATTDFTINYVTSPVKPTTFKYPTAVWSSYDYEKYKNNKKNRSKVKLSRAPTNFSFSRNSNHPNSTKSQNYNRIGKTKWKDIRSSFSYGGYNQIPIFHDNEYADKFLEYSLDKYLTSSNLKNTFGNVSVKRFSELLQNITEPKSKTLSRRYDENKELRIKFREEVILKKKNETKLQEKFLEKQLQKRLEKIRDVSNEKDKSKILPNMWKYASLNRTGDVLEEKKIPIKDDHAVISESRKKNSNEHIRGTIKYSDSTYPTVELNRNKFNSFKLSVEESSYYHGKSFPSLTYMGRRPATIPGMPHKDYPIYSLPPTTKFTCPRFKGGKPKMIADRDTRCQVFYICTGDGPTTAMICPNGTMFNENFLVCDWWYNVRC